jgi:hypothetical protein
MTFVICVGRDRGLRIGVEEEERVAYLQRNQPQSIHREWRERERERETTVEVGE